MKDKRMGRRFGLLDAVLVVLAVLLLVGVWQRDALRELFTTEEVLDEYTVTFEVKKVRSTTAELLKKDVAFTTEHEGERVLLGTLVRDVAASAATEQLRNEEGDLVDVVYPEDEYEYLWDVGGELSCEGLMRDGSFLVGGKLYLARNKVVRVQTETADFDIVIKDIAKVEQPQA